MSTKRWLGSATAVNDVWTLSVSGTVVSQTYTITINGKTVTYTAGSGDSVSTILGSLQVAFAASTAPEFAELTAVALPAAGPYTSITLTGVKAGVPSTVAFATGGGATASITNTTPATGPNDFTNTANWSGGVAPANSDTLAFDAGSVPCKYNLSTSLTGINLIVDVGYTGAIGLPLVNTDNTLSYSEYRTAYLTLAGGTVTVNGTPTRCNVAFGSNTSIVRVNNSGQRPDRNVPVVLITGGNGSSELDITKGDVGLAFYNGQTATFPTIRTSYINQPAADVTLYCGSGCTLTTVTTNGGTVTINSAVTTLTQKLSKSFVYVNAGAITTLNIYGGTCTYNGAGTLGTASLANDATLDFNQSVLTLTVTNPISVTGGSASVKDDNRRVNSGTLSVTTVGTSALNISHGNSGNTCTFA